MKIKFLNSNWEPVFKFKLKEKMKDITDINPLIRESKNDGIYIQDENRNYNSLNSIPHEHSKLLY